MSWFKNLKVVAAITGIVLFILHALYDFFLAKGSKDSLERANKKDQELKQKQAEAKKAADNFLDKANKLEDKINNIKRDAQWHKKK